MERQSGTSYSYTADYTYIDRALRSRWEPFSQLAAEVAAFVPQTTEDFAIYREAELARLKPFNPEKSQTELLSFVDSQISAYVSSPQLQLHTKFADRVMAEYVTVALLSHALCEASANALLAIGFSLAGYAEQFSQIERKGILWKWQEGPKRFCADYSLPESSSLFVSLKHLTNQRNEFVHYKIELEMGGKKLVRGSSLHRAPLADHLAWIRRFFSLPYDLVTYACQRIPQLPAMILFDSAPIMRVGEHNEA